LSSQQTTVPNNIKTYPKTVTFEYQLFLHNHYLQIAFIAALLHEIAYALEKMTMFLLYILAHTKKPPNDRV